MRRNSLWVEHSQVIIDKLHELNLAMTDVETSQRGYLLTSDTSFLDLLIVTRDQIPLLLDTLIELTRDNLTQTQNAIMLHAAVVQRLQKVESILNGVKYFSIPELTIELKDGKKLIDEFRMRTNTMQYHEQLLMKSRTHDQQEYENLTPNYFKVILFITMVTATVSFILLLKELKQRLAAQSQLEKRVNTLAQVNAELQQIAHVTSHDLQEPLRKIRMFIDALRIKFASNLPDEANIMLQRLDKNVTYIRAMVADLSDFADLAHNDEKKFADVDLNKILSDVQGELTSIISPKKGTFSISVLPRIGGFEKQLHTLFKELLTNALKFSHEDKPVEMVITGNIVNGKMVTHDLKFGNRNFNVVSVQDNGIGFENEYAEKIFVLFQKLSGNDSLSKGKGIGLAICQRIMANHGGFITASGEIGKGATFQLYFPID